MEQDPREGVPIQEGVWVTAIQLQQLTFLRIQEEEEAILALAREDAASEIQAGVLVLAAVGEADKRKLLNFRVT